MVGVVRMFRCYYKRDPVLGPIIEVVTFCGKVIKIKNCTFYAYLAVEPTFAQDDFSRFKWRWYAPQCPEHCVCKPVTEEEPFYGGPETYSRMERMPCPKTIDLNRPPVKSTEIVSRWGFYGYEERKRLFARVGLSDYAFVKQFIRNTPYKSNLPLLKLGAYGDKEDAVADFLHQLKAHGNSWVDVPSDTPDFSEVRVVDGPLTTASYMVFDIETLAPSGKTHPRKGHPVAMISAVRSTGEKKLFYWGKKIEEQDYIGFDNESDMIVAFAEYIVQTNPNFLIGFNSNEFDIPYLMIREPRFRNIGIGGRPMRRIRKATRTNQSGTISVSQYDCFGRIVFDCLEYARSKLKLSKYSLKAVIKFLELPEDKDDLPYKEIYGHFYGTDEQRAKLAKYCLQDSIVTAMVAEKLGVINSTLATAETNCVETAAAIERGVTYLNAQLTYREIEGSFLIAAPNEDRLPVSYANLPGFCELLNQSNEEDGYEGATVLDPVVGMHVDPVAVFDFASLYPSIMIANNLCHTTLILDRHEPRDAYEWPTPLNKPFHGESGHFFTRDRPGVFPVILKKLLALRAEEKKKMEQFPEHSVEYKIMDQKQNAKKIAANSIYGACGTAGMTLSCIVIAMAVTGYGRECLLRVRDFVNKSGSELRPVVIYGDTDSVMVKAQAGDTVPYMDLFEELKNKINSTIGFNPPMKMALENVATIFLLIEKKRYMYWLLKVNKKTGKREIKFKGLEIVRRDGFPYMVQVMKDVFDLIVCEETRQNRVQKEKIYKYITEALADLGNGRVPLEDLELTCNISKELPGSVGGGESYKSENLAQVHVARQLINAGFDASPGTRVEFYYANTGKKKTEQVVAKMCAPDGFVPYYARYLERITGPLERFLSHVIGETAARTLLHMDRYAKGQLSMEQFLLTTPAIPEAKVRERPAKRANVKSASLLDFFKKYEDCNHLT